MAFQKDTRDKLGNYKDIFTVYTGLQKKGKTYHAALEVQRWVSKGGIVATNGTFDFRKTFPKLKHENIRIIQSLKDILSFRNSLIIWDEAHLTLDSRDWSELGKVERILLTQLGKMHNHIILIVHDFDRLDTIPRDLCEKVVEHHRVGKFFWWKKFLPQDIKRAKRKMIGFGFARFDIRIGESYRCDEFFGKPFKDTIAAMETYPISAFEDPNV